MLSGFLRKHLYFCMDEECPCSILNEVLFGSEKYPFAFLEIKWY